MTPTARLRWIAERTDVLEAELERLEAERERIAAHLCGQAELPLYRSARPDRAVTRRGRPRSSRGSVQMVMAILAASPEPVRFRTVVELTALPINTVSPALQELRRRGKAQRIAYGMWQATEAAA